jgi:cation transport ATPase
VTDLMLDARRACVTCASGGRAFLGRYREFLPDPGTLVTLASLALLGGATLVDPGALVGRSEEGVGSSPLYLASALAGSIYIWWSAFRGIREGDFTAGVPVSLATAAAIGIGQYPAAAVVAAARASGIEPGEPSEFAPLPGLSARAVAVIRQNLAFSLGVLGLAVALTVVGILTPVTGALLHELSSIPVIANSARLIGAGERAGSKEATRRSR